MSVDSVDYRGIDDPLQRVARLVEACQGLSGDLVLVGSSLGGYVALAAAALLHARGVFLMAPAIYMRRPAAAAAAAARLPGDDRARLAGRGRALRAQRALRRASTASRCTWWTPTTACTGSCA